MLVAFLYLHLKILISNTSAVTYSLHPLCPISVHNSSQGNNTRKTAQCDDGWRGMTTVHTISRPLVIKVVLQNRSLADQENNGHPLDISALLLLRSVRVQTRQENLTGVSISPNLQFKRGSESSDIMMFQTFKSLIKQHPM
ncbi:hypothetical protein GGR54DRAFT_391777 [Hypoxylon sp. NC1633]|nr:hypothetical protein GGR54DRAFT_391777 [Hypoxylon sp. NC1633]